MSKADKAQQSTQKPLLQKLRDANIIHLGRNHAGNSVPLKRVLWRAIREYPRHWRALTVATFLPIACVGILRWMTEDLTGDQYALLIILISMYSTFLTARVAVAGWDMRKVKVMTLYSTVMLRYLSAIGLLVVISLFALPFVGGLFLSGITLLGAFSRWLLLITVPLSLIGILLISRAGLALFALADDMEVTVLEAFQISSRITKRYFWQYFWRIMAVGALVVAGSLALTLLGSLIGKDIQDPVVQLCIDLFGSWLFSPFFIFLLSRLYQALVEAYE